MVRLLFSFGNLVGIYKTRAIQERQKRKAPKGFLNPPRAYRIGIFRKIHLIINPGE